MLNINKSIPCDTSNHGGSRKASQIKYIVIHYTANDNDRASSNCRYFSQPNRRASAHYFVSEKEVYQSVDDLTVAWSVGGRKYPSASRTGGGKFHGKCTNTNSISIEMCNSVKRVPDEVAAHVKELVAMLMKKYRVPKENIIRHFDVVGKLCPASLVDHEKWLAFKEYIFDEGYNFTKVKVNLYGQVKLVNSININYTNYIKLRDLACQEIRVGYVNRSVTINDKPVALESILYEDTNYIKVRELEKIGIKIGWDAKTSTIQIGE